MAEFAKGTKVSEKVSRAEIEDLLEDAGCTEFGYRSNESEASVLCLRNGISYRFRVVLPGLEEFRTVRQNKYSDRRRSDSETRNAWEAERRRRWRALALIVKAKCIAISEGVVSFEEEFLGNALLADNRTVAETLIPALERAAAIGSRAALALPEAGDA